ncbi:hypothetical protein DRQ20_00615 [bacterium]|nr:MAG: hypothetical protein DRQ20_00615 [bacterium]
MHLLEGWEIETLPVRDPIYNFIEIPREFISLIDSEIFQRLRWISQTPLEQLVYPSVAHSRFEHSLGTMYLAMIAAVSLIRNSPARLEAILKEDDAFRSLSPKERERQFILSAGAIGLLHDLGHPPFSHALEEACEYIFEDEKHFYNHEIVSYYYARILLRQKKVKTTPWGEKALSVLKNKKSKEKIKLSPVENLLLTLIDGPIDVDKGDYLLRDSYHCGTTYGLYDRDRLWRNIIITKDNQLGVHPKGAVEAWALRIARYRLGTGVYQHHTRNIIDAMLIDILCGIEKECLPLIIPDYRKKEKFLGWTEHTFLNALMEAGDSRTRRKVERLRKRELYKRGFEINLIEFPELLIKETVTQVKRDLLFWKDSLSSRVKDKIIFLVDRIPIPPVFEKEVQKEIIVEENGNEKPLAEYLGFKLEETQIVSCPWRIFIFVDKDLKDNKEILEGIEKDLREYLEKISKPLS